MGKPEIGVLTAGGRVGIVTLVYGAEGRREIVVVFDGIEEVFVGYDTELVIVVVIKPGEGEGSACECVNVTVEYAVLLEC